jgi:hypothetical protein
MRFGASTRFTSWLPLLSSEELALATWDRRLHRAARAAGLDVLPDRVEE